MSYSQQGVMIMRCTLHLILPPISTTGLGLGGIPGYPGLPAASGAACGDSTISGTLLGP